jgi:hypothetical protein
MAEMRVSTGALAETIDLYLKLLDGASRIESELKSGGRRELDEQTRAYILSKLKDASAALAQGCPEGVYGLFLTD